MLFGLPSGVRIARAIHINGASIQVGIIRILNLDQN